MTDLAYCIENYHKPRMGKLAEFLLTESEFDYDYFEPPAFETHLVQVKLSDELILSINYFPIELSEEAPYLFLQLHCLIMEQDGAPSADMLRYLSHANNVTELSSFHFNDGQLYLKSVIIDDPEQPLNIAKVAFAMRIFYNNLADHIEDFQRLAAGASFESLLSD